MNKDYSWPNSGWDWSKKDCVLCGRRCESIYGAICDRCLTKRRNPIEIIMDMIEKVFNAKRR